jgi:uncharacterized protein (DUF697 family)
MIIDRVATIFCSEKDTIAKAIIYSVAVEAGSVGLFTAQIPGDRLVIAGQQIDMILRLAKVYGRRIDRTGAIAIGKAGLAMAVGPEAVNQILKYVPIIGNLANLSVAAGVTAAIGYTSMKWFKDGTWVEKAQGANV